MQEYIIIIIIIITHNFFPELLDEVTYFMFQERGTIYVKFYTLHGKIFSCQSFFPIVGVRNMKFKPSLYTH